MLKTFAYHKPSARGVAKIAALREAYTRLYESLDALGIASRELSIAKTELEASAMWAVKSVVHNDPDSVVEN